MKKSLLLSLFAAAGLCASAAVGDTFVVDGLTYTVTAADEVSVTDVDNTVTNAVIPETVDNAGTSYSVTAIGRDAFYYAKAATVTLPNSVKEIGYGAFRSSDLVSITFGTGLETIGDWAFAYDKITSIAIPEGVTSIGTSAFASCKQLTAITFPSTLTAIGGSCFYNASLTSVEIPASVTQMGPKVFLSCTKLTSVTLPDGLTAIGDAMFQQCSLLTSIDIPASVTYIGEDAFLESGLTSVTIPAGVNEIGGSAFAAPNLASIAVDEVNTSFVVVDDALYNADRTLLYAYPAKSTNTVVTVDPACLGIYNAAFWKGSVTKVTLGDKVRAIDEYAFCFCSSLTDINLPNSILLIGTEAFASTGLPQVTLPNQLAELQEAVFAGCKSLTTATLPASLTYMDIRGFWGCTALQTVNCFAMTPPVIEDWYEAYEAPFYNVPSSCKLHVPAAALSAYQANSNWKASISSTNMIGDLASTIQPTTFAPAADASVSSYDGTDITFDEEVTIVKSNPQVKVICGHLTVGVPVGETVAVDQWYLVKGTGTGAVRIFPADYDGYTSPFNMLSGNDYYVQVPAGVVKNAAGELNEAFTIHYAGAYVAPVVDLVSVSPASESQVAQVETITFTFAESVSLVTSKLSSITSTVGAMTDGVITGVPGPEDEWCGVAGKTSGTTIAIFPADYDSFLTPIPTGDKNVYIQLPAGLFRLTSSYSTVSEPITLIYLGTTGSLEAIDAEADAPVEYYTLDGVRVANPLPGRIYILRQGNIVAKQLVR